MCDDKNRRILRHCYINKFYYNGDIKAANVYFYSDDSAPTISQSAWFLFDSFKDVKEFDKICKSKNPSKYEFYGTCLVTDNEKQLYDFKFKTFEPLVIDDELKELILKVFSNK